MTDPNERPIRVFLCHASADKPAARRLYRYLRTKGMDPWLDEFKLLAGQRWQEEIPKALYSSDAIIVVLSKNSITKEGYVQREIKFALDKALEMPEGRIFLIPARLEECEVPQSLKDYQWVDLFQKNWNRRLMASLNERIAELNLTPLPIPKKESQPPAITGEDTSEQVSIPYDKFENTKKAEGALAQSAVPSADTDQAVASKDDASLTPASELTETSKVIEPTLDRNDVLTPAKHEQAKPEQVLAFEALKEEQTEKPREETPRAVPDQRSRARKFNLRLVGGVALLMLAVASIAWVISVILESSSKRYAEATALAQATLLTEQAATFQAALTQTTSASRNTEATARAQATLLTEQAATFQAALTQTTSVQTLTPTAPMIIVPTFTAVHLSEPTPVLAVVQASEGGGAFVREIPFGKVLATVANGTTVTLLPNDMQEVNGIMWAHVFVRVNDARIEGWMVTSVLVTAIPDAN